MIVIVATIQVKPDKVRDFEQVARELEAAVEANEAGCLMYRMTKSRIEAFTYKNVECFRDQDALDLHTESAYFQAALKPLRECVSAPSHVEFLDTLIE